MLILIGGAFEASGRYQDALARYEGALKTLAVGPQALDPALGQSLSELAPLAKGFTGGRGAPVGLDLYRGELPALDRVLGEPQGGRQLAFVAALNAGNMYLQQGQYRQADLLYRQALSALGPKDAVERRQVHANLAWSAIKRGAWQEARAQLDLALAGKGTGDSRLELRRALLAVAVAAREQGDPARAVKGLEEAVALYHKAGDVTGEARARAHLGTAYLQAGKDSRAVQEYERALALNRQGNDPETEWHAQAGLARARQRAGDLERSLAAYEAYLKVVERLGEGLHTDQGKVSFFESHDRLLEDYVRAAAARAGQTGDFNGARQAVQRVRERALGALLEARRGGPPEPPGTLAASLLFPDLPAPPPDEAPAVAAGPVAAKPWLQMAPAVPAGPAEAEPALSRSTHTPEPMTWLDEPVAPPAPENAEPPPATLLEYYVMSDQTLILVRGAAGEVNGAVVPLGAAEVERRVQEYRAALDLEAGRGLVLAMAAPDAGAGSGERSRGVPPEESRLAARLYQELIAPVRGHLPAAAGEVVVIVPHRALWLLPFAALRSADGRYLGDEHLLAYSPSESVWREAAGRVRPRFHEARAWVVGNPRMPARFEACGAAFELQPLPGAEAEAQAVKQAFGDRADLFLGEQADGLRLRAWHPAYGVLHLATHGVACPEAPLDSFVVLSAVEAGEARLDPATATLTRAQDDGLPVTLRGLPLDPADTLPPVTYPGMLTAWTVAREYTLAADLVTLSACQTGLGKALGQGNIGFTRAFLAAGARSLLVSLWRVDDEATRELMTAFYREYLDHGNKALALQRAMQATRQAHAAPRYWAAFTLVGAAQ